MKILLTFVDAFGSDLAAMGFCLVSGLVFRLTLSFIGQRWVRTFHHTMTYLLLPPITFVITKVISGNIALSLGMIGALSIVRFRNPVKNPLELVIFFALLTIGIAAGVALKWAMALTVVSATMFLVMHYLERFFASIGKTVFSLSFDEGNPAHIIEVTATRQMPQLDSSPWLQYFSHSNETGTYSYKLALRDRKSAQELDNALLKEDGVQKSLVRYSNYS